MLAEFDFRVLADVDAVLNALAFTLICAGLVAIKRGRVRLHKRLMLGAAWVSALFLCSYVTYHLNAPSVRFTREGWIRPVYFTLLISHIVLAMAAVPLVAITVTRALRGQLDKHVRIARVTIWIWLYVSVTGILVYVALYGTSLGARPGG